jgi:hypothetical protein
VGQHLQALQKRGAEVIVAPLPLNRLQDHRRNLVFALVEVALGLVERLLLLRRHALHLVPIQRKVHLGVGDARPVELREVHRLPRVGRVGERHGVAAPPVEGLIEVQHLVPHLAPVALLVVLAHLPVERRFQGIFHRQRAPRNKEGVRQILGNADPVEGVHKPRHVPGHDVGVGNLVERRVHEPLQEGLVARHLGMVHAERVGGVKPKQINERAARFLVVEAHPAAAIKVKHHRHHPFRKDVLRQELTDVGGTQRVGRDRFHRLVG